MSRHVLILFVLIVASAPVAAGQPTAQPPKSAGPSSSPKSEPFRDSDPEVVYAAAEELYLSAVKNRAAGAAGDWALAADLCGLFREKVRGKTPPHPKAALTAYWYGVALRESDRPADALLEFRKAKEEGLDGETGIRLRLDTAGLLYDRFRRGRSMADHAECVALYREAAQMAAPNPLPPEGRVGLAIVLREKFPDADAAREVIKVVDGLTVPNLKAVGYLLRADAHLALEEYAAAAAAYQQFRAADRFHPRAARSALVEAQCRLRGGDPAGAEKIYRELLAWVAVRQALTGTDDSDWPRSVVTFGLAHAVLARGKVADAQPLFDACALDPMCADKDNARLLGAECRAKRGQYLDAAQWARPLVEGPLDARARLLAADCYFRDGKYQEVNDVLRQGRPAGTPLHGQEKEIWQYAGVKGAETVYQIGDPPNVRAAAERFEALAPDLDHALRVLAYHNAGKCRFQLREWAKAVAAFERQLKVDEAGELAFEAQFRKGLAHLELKQWEPAQAAVAAAAVRARATGDRVKAADVLLLAGNKTELAGQTGEAGHYYSCLLAEPDGVRAETLAAVRDGMARLAIGRRAFAEAAGHLLDGLAHRPVSETARVCYLAGQCHTAAGDRRRALDLYRRASSTRGPDEWVARALLAAGRCLDGLNEPKAALDMFYDLATRYPTRPEGVEAERRLVAARPRWRRIDGLN